MNKVFFLNVENEENIYTPLIIFKKVVVAIELFYSASQRLEKGRQSAEIDKKCVTCIILVKLVIILKCNSM